MKKVFNVFALCFAAMVFCACHPDDGLDVADTSGDTEEKGYVPTDRTNNPNEVSVTGNGSNLSSIGVTLQAWANLVTAYDTEMGIEISTNSNPANSGTPYPVQSLGADHSYSVYITKLRLFPRTAKFQREKDRFPLSSFLANLH